MNNKLFDFLRNKMEELLLEREQLEEKLKNVNIRILRISIRNELDRLRVLCDGITNENFQKGLDYFYLANILGIHNHRGRGYTKLFDMALEKLNLSREDVEEIDNLYEKWLEWKDFKDIEEECNLAYKIRRYGEPEEEYVINRP